MRVLGGLLRSRKLFSLKTKEIRPVTSRLKKIIFDTLGQDLTEMSVLDLFAGVGSLGIEALSRGAQRVVFVENNDRAILCIRKNLLNLNIGKKGEVIPSDVFKAIIFLEKRATPFDIIFVDPPYSQGFISKALMCLDRSDILRPFGKVVTEYSRQEGLPENLFSLALERTKRFGITCLSFLIKMPGIGNPIL